MIETLYPVDGDTGFLAKFSKLNIGSIILCDGIGQGNLLSIEIKGFVKIRVRNLFRLRHKCCFCFKRAYKKTGN